MFKKKNLLALIIAILMIATPLASSLATGATWIEDDDLKDILQNYAGQTSTNDWWKILLLGKSEYSVSDADKAWLENNTGSGPAFYAKQVLAKRAAGLTPTATEMDALTGGTTLPSNMESLWVAPFVLAALDAVDDNSGPVVARRAQLVDHILSRQIQNSGDNQYLWNEWGVVDVTGNVLAVMQPHYNEPQVQAAVNNAIPKFAAWVSPDGTMGHDDNNSWAVDNGNSTAMALLGVSSYWVENISISGNQYFTDTQGFADKLKEGLMTYKLQGDAMGFGYTNNTSFNAMATEQAARALLNMDSFKNQTNVDYRGVYNLREIGGSTPPVNNYSIRNTGRLSFAVGGSYYADAFKLYNGDEEVIDVEWDSSDETVAKVDYNGVITPYAIGYTVITAKVSSQPVADITIGVFNTANAELPAKNHNISFVVNNSGTITTVQVTGSDFRNYPTSGVIDLAKKADGTYFKQPFDSWKVIHLIEIANKKNGHNLNPIYNNTDELLTSIVYSQGDWTYTIDENSTPTGIAVQNLKNLGSYCNTVTFSK